MRAVLDTNVLISSALAPSGASARLLRAWRAGAFDMVVSELLLDELTRAFDYPKLTKRIAPANAGELVSVLRRGAELADDPAEGPPIHARDRDDDYLIALAAATNAAIVPGDTALLELAPRFPVYSPSEFLALIETA